MSCSWTGKWIKPADRLEKSPVSQLVLYIVLQVLSDRCSRCSFCIIVRTGNNKSERKQSLENTTAVLTQEEMVFTSIIW